MKPLLAFPLSLVIAAGLAGSSHAQSATGSASSKPAVHAAAKQGADTPARAGLAGRPDAWRYKYHNNVWWYYHPNNTWSIWNGSSWTPYISATTPYTPFTTGYRGITGSGTFGPAVTGNLPETDAVPGRSNPQMSGGGIGINGSPLGTNDVHDRNGGLPNLGGGALSRGGNAGRGISDTDAIPGRSNLQMSGGGIGVNGSPVPSANTGGPAAQGSRATDALPGERDPQMSGGGLGVNGSSAGGAGS